MCQLMFNAICSTAFETGLLGSTRYRCNQGEGMNSISAASTGVVTCTVSTEYIRVGDFDDDRGRRFQVVVVLEETNKSGDIGNYLFSLAAYILFCTSASK